MVRCRCWMGEPLQRLGAFDAHRPTAVTSVAFGLDDQRIVSGGADNTVRVWDSLTFAPIGRPRMGHHGEVSSVVFDRDGTRIVSGSVDGSVRVWDAIAGLPIPAEQRELSLVLWPSVPTVDRLPRGADGTVRLWDRLAGRLIGRFGAPLSGDEQTISNLAFSPDGRTIALGATMAG